MTDRIEELKALNGPYNDDLSNAWLLAYNALPALLALVEQLEKAVFSSQIQLANCKPEPGYSKNHKRVALINNNALAAAQKFREGR